MDAVCEPVRCGLARGRMNVSERVMKYGAVLEVEEPEQLWTGTGTWGVRRACEVRFEA
jgi:hypothetical protein